MRRSSRRGMTPTISIPAILARASAGSSPTWIQSEEAYRLARRRPTKPDGREVLDATVGGKLRVFPKVDYDSLF